MKQLAEKYFAAWNTNVGENLRPLFSENVTLKDWEISKSGITDVIAANQGIFDNVPGIQIKVKDIALSENQAMCEIDVIVSDTETLHVVDVLTIKNGKISAVKAFKI